MKLSLAVAASFLPLCLGQFANNLPDCVAEGSYDPDRDYFPDKVTATESLFWDIQYFNNYKILRNELAGETYVLYQCGTPPPTDQANAGHEHFIPVPLKDGITLSSTTHIPHLELLGLRTEVKAWIGYSSFISSPCLNKMINEADITVIGDAETNQAAVDGLKDTFGSDLVSFHNNRDSYESTVMNVTVSAFAEKSNEAIYEWNKYFAAFFNMEKKANELFKTTSERYTCVAEEAIDIVDVLESGIKPTVVWATYTNFNGADGWTVANCPNYYCEYAELCASELVSSLDGTIEFFGSMIFTTEDFVALAKDAEHFIYPSGNWDEAYAAYGPVLDTFKSVKDKKVFDNQGSIANSWFENRLAEYDVVLQDFCSVVGTGDPLHTRVWMRNVFNEPKGGALGECTDIDAPLVSRASPCRKVVFLPGEFCFSGENTVDLEDGSSLKMKDLSLGDRVKTGDGTFESVYTFAHYHHDIEAEFVQIFAKSMSNNPLELSADHMVFLHGKDAPAPAGSLVVGDTLLLGDGQSAEIVKLKQVTRHGAYAPFTASGSIVVNNVVASNYISFESGPYMTIGGMQYVSYHWMSHLTQAPRRLYCSMVSNCEKESYTEQGVAVWAVAPLHAGQWWMGLNNSIVKGILIGITLAVLLIVASMEAVVNNSWMLTAAVGSVGLLCHRSAKQQQGKTVA